MYCGGVIGSIVPYMCFLKSFQKVFTDHIVPVILRYLVI